MTFTDRIKRGGAIFHTTLQTSSWQGRRCAAVGIRGALRITVSHQSQQKVNGTPGGGILYPLGERGFLPWLGVATRSVWFVRSSERRSYYQLPAEHYSLIYGGI